MSGVTAAWSLCDDYGIDRGIDKGGEVQETARQPAMAAAGA